MPIKPENRSRYPADWPQIVFLSLPEVLKRVPVGRTAWYDAIKAGEAPKPVKLGGASMWPAHEIDALARKMMTERGEG